MKINNKNNDDNDEYIKFKIIKKELLMQRHKISKRQKYYNCSADKVIMYL